MNDNYQEMLEQAFADPTALSPDKVRGLVEETVHLFEEIRKKFESKDPDEHEEALALSMEVKKALAGQMERISKITGIDPSQFEAFAENEKSMSKEDAEIVAEVRDRLQVLGSGGQSAPHVRKQSKKTKILG